MHSSQKQAGVRFTVKCRKISLDKNLISGHISDVPLGSFPLGRDAGLETQPGESEKEVPNHLASLGRTRLRLGDLGQSGQQCV